MELEYPVVMIVGAGLAAVMMVLSFFTWGKGHFTGGKKIANPSYLEDDPYYKKKRIQYAVLNKLLAFACACVIFACSWLLAHPYTQKIEVEDRYSRDIILCMDISTSVDALNEKLCDELENTVKELEGERFGIVIFNTTPVLLVPLTDDYEFIIEQLETIKDALVARNRYWDYGIWTNNLVYLNEYVSAGTQVNSEERGSSLIGDGLASCVNDFSDLDEERTRIVIFSSDNQLEGDPLVTITEAAELCEYRDVTVYGVGTKEMDDDDMEEMKSACELTGGAFFLEENSATFSTIVDRITQASENLVEGNKVIKKVDKAGPAYAMLLLSLTAVFVLLRIVRR